MRKFLFAYVSLLLIPHLLSAQFNKATVSPWNPEKIKQISGSYPIVQRTTDINTCDTWSFQIAFNSSQTEHPADILQLPTKSYIICGNSDQASNKNGRLIKLNENGHAVLSKQVAIPGVNIELNKLHYISSGYLYAIGTSTDVNTGNSIPVLVNIDTSTLAVVSVVQCQISSGSNNWKGFGLAEQTDTYMYLLAYNDSLINVTKFTPGSMNILWSKTYHPKNHPQIVGMGAFDAALYVGWNEQDSGYTKGVLLGLNYTNGNFDREYKLGGAAEGLNVQFQSISVADGWPRFTAIQYNNNQTNFIRVIFDGNGPIREVYSISGFNPSPGMISQQNRLSESIAFQQQSGSSQLSIIQTFPNYYFSNELIRTWNINFPSGLNLKKHAMSFDGGSISLADYSGGILVSKTDSVVSACNSTQVPSSSNLQFSMPYVKETLSPLPYTFQFSAINLTETDIPLSETVLCQTLSCPVVPEPEGCQRTFLKEYRNNTNAITARQLLNIGNGNMLITGIFRPNTDGPGYNFSLTKIDTLGHISDAKMLAGASIYKVIRLHDGNLLGVGTVTVNSTPDLYLIKFDTQFSIIWQRRLVTNPYYNGFGDVIESSEGDFYGYLIANQNTTTETRTILKLDPTGKPIWLNEYTVSPNAFLGSGEYIPALIELGDAIVIKYNDEDGDFSPYLMSLKKTNGSINWNRKYQMGGPFYGSQVYALTTLITDGNNIYMNGRSQDRDQLLRIRPDGSVSLAKRINFTTTVSLGQLFSLSNHHLLMGAGNSSFVQGVVEMDTSFNMIRSQYMRLPKYGWGNGLQPIADSLVYSIGNFIPQNNYWASFYFGKFNFNSSFSNCQVTDQIISLDSFQQSVIIKSVPQVSLTLPQVFDFNANFLPIEVSYAAYYCGNNSLCSKIQLQGTNKICDTSNVYSYSVNRNVGCTGFVNWKMDTLISKVKIISVTDSVLKLKAVSSGIFTVRARIYATCGWVEDSVIVNTTANPGKLDLGKDTVICPGNTLLLHAGGGFSSYLWQDGTTDSILKVTQPGMYYVQTGSCGNTITDTVIISPHPPIPFDINRYRLKCNNDTVHLDAPAGFLNYTWSNNYNISSTTAQHVVVNPLSDTSYYIKAEKTPGCFAYDTVRIHVNTSPVVNLGPDVNLCNGDSVKFDAGAGFYQYTWNNGNSTELITAKIAGSYSVIASTFQGCKSYDTVRILNVFANPVVSLDHNHSLCTGTSRVLDAGSFTSYLWNDGSTGEKNIADKTGTYTVQVTDINGCKGMDSSIITTYLPLPAAFLPKDTSICSYEKLTVNPRSPFKSYLWNTGSNSPSITISQPGIYWLQVKDANGCTGIDSITVNPKSCMEGFYVPTAFTPNNDGKNDVFRPLIYGNIKKYQFTIYNRWGQIVFQTTEINKAWDGKVAGLIQDSNVFVWSCTYQFEGKEEKMEKGTVVLIK